MNIGASLNLSSALIGSCPVLSHLVLAHKTARAKAARRVCFRVETLEVREDESFEPWESIGHVGRPIQHTKP